MDINKIPNNVNDPVKGTGASGRSNKTARVDENRSDSGYTDKIDFEKFGFKKDDQKFALLELDKLNRVSFEQLKDYKAKIREYERAKSISDDAARQTGIGKLINNPEVWSDIARKMTE